MRSRYLVSIVVAVLVSTFAFAFAAGAQETKQAPDVSASATASASAKATDTQNEEPQQPVVFAEGEQAQAEAENDSLSGPLAGTRVSTRSTDPDMFVEVILIPGPTCLAKKGASFVLQDEDGTQADFIDRDNVKITEVRKGLKVVSFPVAEDKNIEPLNQRGGDGVLDTGGLKVVTSTDIKCEGGGDDNGDGGGGGDNGGGNGGGDSPLDPEPQDEEKGPLAGGTAIGKDVLVPGDVIRVLPDGTEVVGIDQIIIKTENCRLTEQGDDLTITLSDQGVPFRLRDGQNVDITIKSDGTIVANGRKTLGDDFPPGDRDNPTRIIVPIPVDPENDEFSSEPNDRFPLISSTGIEGEGCRVLEPDDTDDNGGSTNTSDDVIPNTTSDQPMPNTGGVPVYLVIVSSLVLASVSALLLRTTLRRNT